MKLKDFFTEYDDEITGGLNVDPLGLLVIWSVYGQKIFYNRVNSISNDIRNYTLNLFHHVIIKELIDDDSVVLGKRLLRKIEKKDSLEFKQRCIIYLENLFVFSAKHSENKPEKDRIQMRGILGSSNARNVWNNEDKNPMLSFSKDKKSQILVRQLLLGVSGRYKTPLIEIGFFNKFYDYQLIDSKPLWEKSNQFIESEPSLKKLKSKLISHMRELLCQNDPKPSILFSEISGEIKSAYVQAFKDPATVGRYSRTFWLAVTGLDHGASGAILSVLDSNDASWSLTPNHLFIAARKHLETLDESSLNKSSVEAISHIQEIEPFLALLDLLFSIARGKGSQKISEIVELWHSYALTEHSIPDIADKIEENIQLREVLNGTGYSRLSDLLEIRNKETVREQLIYLLNYHIRIMNKRGPLPWLSIEKDDLIKCYVKNKKLPKVNELEKGFWNNKYYIPQFKNLAKGLSGEMQ